MDSAPLAANLLFPEDTESDVSTVTILNWLTGPFGDASIVEVSTDPSFSNILFTATVDDNVVTTEGLTTSTIYYWRVKSTNICGEGPYSSTFRFRTGTQTCNTYINDTNVDIPEALSLIHISEPTRPY